MLAHSHLSFINPDHKSYCSAPADQHGIGGPASGVRVTSFPLSCCLLYYPFVCNYIGAKYKKAGKLPALFVTVLVCVPSEADPGTKICASNLSEK